MSRPHLHHLGATRSSLKPDHLLQTPDTFIRTPLPGAVKVDFIIHAAPQLGAAFTQMTAEFAAGGSLGPTPAQRFIYVIEGKLKLKVGNKTHTLSAGSYAYLPQGAEHTVTATSKTRAALIEKIYQPQPGSSAPEIVVAFDSSPTTISGADEPGCGWYQPQPGSSAPEIVVGEESKVATVALMGDEGLRVRSLMPDGPPYDFAVNTMTYDPGAALSVIEIHVMEHGLLMLEGGGIYRLGDAWYPVEAGDFIWMGPYCPQWFGAIGKQPAKYLIYKDWRRHPLGAVNA